MASSTTTSPSDSSPTPNPFLLAADASAKLLPLLHANPSLASAQDSHGYTLLHALTSYNHLSLLREFNKEFRTQIDPNVRDEDGETALFGAETVAAAQCLVEEVGVDVSLTNAEGQTAEEKIRSEGEFVTVADFLAEVRRRSGARESAESAAVLPPPPLPEGVTLNVGAVEPEDVPGEVDPEFRRRIEDLAARDDFAGEDAQRELRALVQDAVRDVGSQDKEARRRVE